MPAINPVAIEISGFALHWYGLLWIAAFAQFVFVTKRFGQPLVGQASLSRVVDSLTFWAILGAFVGGRIGYVFIYGLDRFAEDPLWLFRIWEGGMSFHGGLVGAIASVWVTSRMEKDVGFLSVADLAALGTPLGLAFGRLGNFINAELQGRPSDVPWAVVFPDAGEVARHPSQLYEMLGEGVLLFVVLWLLVKKGPMAPGLIAATFCSGYAAVRFLLEFFREPDAHMGYFAFGLTAGQLLSLPMLLLGLGLFAFIAARK